jgi:dolichol-phosphate mannosyltransferase
MSDAPARDAPAAGAPDPKRRPLVFIPTYNEIDHVALICQEIRGLGVDLDILFMDDNSPDGTGQALDRLALAHSNVQVRHRAGKLGIGSAHAEGIEYACAEGYRILITLDCDFAHPPRHIVDLLREAQGADVVLGSRYLAKRSLAGWSPVRKLKTWTGHLMTRLLLGMSYDATGALRLYRLDRIPRRLWTLVRSQGYSFFFESLYVLHVNRHRIKEVPIALPPRTCNHSSMTPADVRRSVALLFSTWLASILHRHRYQVGDGRAENARDPHAADDQGWDDYWKAPKRAGGLQYDVVAAFYRNVIMKRTLNHFVRRNFPRGAEVLHAGCGSGQVDADISRHVRITGLDISVNALNLYARTTEGRCAILHGSILRIPLQDRSMDGIYNLGVMEHFTEEEIDRILMEFRRVLRDDGRLVIFWPPEFGAGVMLLKGVEWTLERVTGRRNVELHPGEITRVRSRRHATGFFERNGFQVARYYFGVRDLFTHSIIVAQKRATAPGGARPLAGRSAAMPGADGRSPDSRAGRRDAVAPPPPSPRRGP